MGLECRVKVLGFRLRVQVWVSGFWEAWGSSGYLQVLIFSARVWVQCLGFGFGMQGSESEDFGAQRCGFRVPGGCTMGPDML